MDDHFVTKNSLEMWVYLNTDSWHIHWKWPLFVIFETLILNVYETLRSKSLLIKSVQFLSIIIMDLHKFMKGSASHFVQVHATPWSRLSWVRVYLEILIWTNVSYVSSYMKSTLLPQRNIGGNKLLYEEFIFSFSHNFFALYFHSFRFIGGLLLTYYLKELRYTFYFEMPW